MDKSIKLLLIGGGLFLAALIGLGLMLNAGEDERVQAAKEASDRRMQPFNMAMDQARQAQEMQREHMRMMQQEMAEAEGYPVDRPMQDQYGQVPMYGE